MSDRPARYTGDHGTENYLDDYVIGPLLLLLIVIAVAAAASWLIGETWAVVGGALLGLGVAVWLVRTEWELRREEST